MDFDHAMRVFRLYCFHFKQDPSQADTMLLTDPEKQAISELKDAIKEHALLFEKDQGGVSMGAHLN